MKLSIPSPHDLWIRFVSSLGLLVLSLHDFKFALIFSLVYSLIYSLFNYGYLYFVVQYASRNLVLLAFFQKLSGIIIFSLLYQKLLKGLLLALGIEVCQLIVSYFNPLKKGDKNNA